MNSKRLRPIVLGAIGLIAALGGCGGTATHSGAEVEALETWGAAALAGARAGDIVVAWERDGERHAITSPLALLLVEWGEAPRAPLTLHLLRRGALGVSLKRTALLRHDEWEVTCRPPLSRRERQLRARALAAAEVEGGERESAMRTLLDALSTAPREARIWAEVEQARVSARAARPVEAESHLARAGGLAHDARERAAIAAQAAEIWETSGEAGRAAAALDAALGDWRAVAPRSPELARALLDFGRLSGVGDRPAAEEQLNEGLGLARAVAPGSILEARFLVVQGNSAYTRGDFEEAEALYRRALEIRERLSPRSPRTADLYGNLGLVAWDQGRLDEAENWIERDLALHVEVAPERPGHGYALNYLGLLARDKGEPELARDRLEQALDILSRDGDTLPVAGMLNNLGNLSRQLGDFAQAERDHRRALEIRRRLAPDSPAVAASHHNLGVLSRLRGDLAAARGELDLALAIKRRHFAASPVLANTLVELGLVDEAAGNLDEAESRLREAFEIRRAVAPGSEGAAVAQILVARVALARGERELGERLWRDGLRRLDAQRDGFDFTPHEKSGFSARFEEHYRKFLEQLVGAGRTDEAFELLERGRARALRALIAEQNERRRGRWSLAEEAQPSVYGVPEVRAALPPRSALVVYSVGDERSHLFVVAGEPDSKVAVHSIELSREELARRVEIFRGLIERGAGRDAGLEPALVAQGRFLFERLVAPAIDAAPTADRWIVVPDGPLTALPFAALVSSVSPLRFLVEDRRLSYAPAASLVVDWARRTAGRPSPPAGSGAAVVIGDPATPRSADRPALPRLPASRVEATSIAELLAPGATLLLDERASEGRIQTLLGRASVLHFAAHGRLAIRYPFESGVELAASAGEDGLLRAWEILEGSPIAARLVTLSGCETGLGRELAGEGILGLSHAFLAAGAEAVVVSLWSVADRSTADLMTSFYGRLRGGESVDRALQAAQVRGLRAGAAAAHPYHWAAFSLLGDGRAPLSFGDQRPASSNETSGDETGAPPRSGRATTRQ